MTKQRQLSAVQRLPREFNHVFEVGGGLREWIARVQVVRIFAMPGKIKRDGSIAGARDSLGNIDHVDLAEVVAVRQHEHERSMRDRGIAEYLDRDVSRRSVRLLHDRPIL